MKFSTDVDLLKWEPMLFDELALLSQTLCRGTDGVLSGTTFTSSGASFVSSGVAAGQVLTLAGGSYEIIAVDSETQLTVSVVRAQADDASIAPPSGEGLEYHISTFDPQAEEVGKSLEMYFSVRSDKVPAEQILNGEALRQASVFAVLAVVFAGSATGSENSDNMWQKSQYYRRQFEQARAAVTVQIDQDGDGDVEDYRMGGAVRLRRI